MRIGGVTYDICARSSSSGSRSASVGASMLDFTARARLVSVINAYSCGELRKGRTEDAHDVLPLADLVHECLVALLQGGLLLLDDLC